MSHRGNKRLLSRHGREIRVAAVPQLLEGSTETAMSSFKQIVEGYLNTRGHRASGVDLELEEAQRSRSLFDTVPYNQRYTYVNEDNYVVKPTDQVVVVDTTAGARTVTLPLSTTPFLCNYLLIARIGANTLTFAAQEGELVNGAATLVFSASYDSGHFVPIHNGWLCSR